MTSNRGFAHRSVLFLSVALVLAGCAPLAETTEGPSSSEPRIRRSPLLPEPKSELELLQRRASVAWDLDLLPTATVHARFVDTRGDGIPGVEMRFPPRELVGDFFLWVPMHRDGPVAHLSDRTGTIHGTIPAFANITIEAVAPGRGTLHFDLGLLRPGEHLDLGTHTIGAGGSIEGQLVDADGSPVPFVPVGLVGLERSIAVRGWWPEFVDQIRLLTDADGRFSCPDLEPQFYMLTLPRGLNPSLHPGPFVEVLPGRTASVRFSHQEIAEHVFDWSWLAEPIDAQRRLSAREGRLQVRFVPIGMHRPWDIAVGEIPWGSIPGYSGELGTVPGWSDEPPIPCPAGSVTVEPYRVPDSCYSWDPVTLEVGERELVELIVPVVPVVPESAESAPDPMWSVEVLVVDPEGCGIPGARFFGMEQLPIAGVTDEQGVARIAVPRVFESGPVVLYVEAPGFVRQRFRCDPEPRFSEPWVLRCDDPCAFVEVVFDDPESEGLHVGVTDEPRRDKYVEARYFLHRFESPPDEGVDPLPESHIDPTDEALGKVELAPGEARRRIAVHPGFVDLSLRTSDRLWSRYWYQKTLEPAETWQVEASPPRRVQCSVRLHLDGQPARFAILRGGGDFPEDVVTDRDGRAELELRAEGEISFSIDMSDGSTWQEANLSLPIDSLDGRTIELRPYVEED